MFEAPYLLFLGDAPDGLAAKMAQGFMTGDLRLLPDSTVWKTVTQIWVLRICQLKRL